MNKWAVAVFAILASWLASVSWCLWLDRTSNVAEPRIMGATAGTPLGSQCVDTQSCAYRVMTPWSQVRPDDASAPYQLWCMYPPLQPEQSVDVCSLVHIQAPGMTDASVGSYSRYCWFGFNGLLSDGGYLFTDFQGGQAQLIGGQNGVNASGQSSNLIEMQTDAGMALCAVAACTGGCMASADIDVDARKYAAYDASVIDSGGGDSGGGDSGGGDSGGGDSGGGSPPTLSGFAATAPAFGSAAGQTYPGTGCGAAGASSCAPVISGTALTGAAVKIGATVSGSTCTGGTSIPGGDLTIASTTIAINTIPSITAGKFQTVCAATSGGAVAYGNGTSTGFTVLPAGYEAYVSDFVGFGSGSNIQTYTSLGDVGTANTPTQATSGNQSTQVTGGAGINGHAATSVAHGSDTYPMSGSVSYLQGDGFFVASEPAGGSSSIECFGTFGSGGSGTLTYNGNYIDSFGATGNWQFLTGPVAPVTSSTFTSAFIYETTCDASGNVANITNGNAQNTTTASVAFATSQVLFGGCGFQSSVGNLQGAAFIFNSKLSSPNRAIVGQYLESWYGVSGGAY